MKIIVMQVVYRGMWVLVMVLVGYGSNVYVECMGEGGLNSIPFWLQASLLETSTCNTLIFWAWTIRNQWL